MNVLLDTCILLDFLQNRNGFGPAAKDLFIAIEKSHSRAYATVSSALDVYYIEHQAYHSKAMAMNSVKKMLSLVAILPSTPDDFHNAVDGPYSDLEDGVMIEAAKRNNMDAIVTRNGKDFAQSETKIYTPSSILNEFVTE